MHYNELYLKKILFIPFDITLLFSCLNDFTCGHGFKDSASHLSNSSLFSADCDSITVLIILLTNGLSLSRILLHS